MTKLSQTPSKDTDRHFRTDHLKRDLKQRSIRGGVVTISAQVSKLVLQTGSTIVLARLLTPEDYGLIGMVKAVTGLISLFNDLGLSMATVQKEEINQAQVSMLFWINLAVGVVLAMLTAALAPLVARFYGEPRLVWIMLVLATGYIFNAAGSQHYALLSRQMRYRALATIDIVSLVVSVAVAIVSAWLGARYWALVLMSLTGGISHSAGFWTMSGWFPSLPSRHSGVRSMLTFGGGLTGTRIISYLTRNLDNVLIGWYWGPQSLGLYTRAYQLLVLPIFSLNAPTRAVAIPTLSRLVESPERYRKAYLRILEKIVMLTMPIVVFLMATSDWLILFLLGPQWSGVSRIFAWLSLVALILPVTYATGWLFVSYGRTWEQFKFVMVEGVIIIASIATGLPWGATGVAAAYSIIGLCVSTPLRFWYVSRWTPVKARDFYRTIAPSLGAALCSLLALFAFRQWLEVSNVVVGLAIAATITALMTLAVLAIVPSGRRGLRDFGKLIALIKRKSAAK